VALVGIYFGSSTWAAARPRTTVPSSHALTLLPAAGDPRLECGSGRPGGVKLANKHVFVTSAAAQAMANNADARVDVQVEDTDIRLSLGPPPWRPPE
jgi:hypothetical protein